MSKKFNNKILLAILAGLLIVFVLVKWYNITKTESTIHTDIVDFDSTSITKLALYPASNKQEEILFTKEKNAWKLSSGKIITVPDPQALKNLISTLYEIKPQRLVAKDKNKWAEFQVADTNATHIKVYEGSQVVLDLFIGKFTYQQSREPNGQMSGAGGIIGTSYVRLNGEEEIYAVNGFLTFSFNQSFNTFRNQSITRLEKPNINKFSIKFPGDSSFIAEKTNGKWLIDNALADSTKIDAYLNELANKTSDSFNDQYKPIGIPTYQLFVETSDKKKISIDAYTNGENQWVLNSSTNPKSWFSSGYNEVFGDLFKPKSYFLDVGKK